MDDFAVSAVKRRTWQCFIASQALVSHKFCSTIAHSMSFGNLCWKLSMNCSIGVVKLSEHIHVYAHTLMIWRSSYGLLLTFSSRPYHIPVT